MLGIYFDEYNDYSDTNKSKTDPKYDHITLTLDESDYEERYKEKSSDDLLSLEKTSLYN